MSSETDPTVVACAESTSMLPAEFDPFLPLPGKLGAGDVFDNAGHIPLPLFIFDFDISSQCFTTIEIFAQRPWDST